MTTWLTYIGGAYKNKTRFLNEAKSQGISRRVPAQVARGFHFGDRVILLRYHSRKGVEAFAEMVINQIIFEKDISEKVREKLKDAIKFIPSGGGSQHIHRECGDYILSASFTIVVDTEKLDIPEMIKAAMEVSGVDTVFCMIGGKLLKTYDQPVWLSPAPKFTRGFIKSDDTTFEYEGEENRIVEIANYRRR